MGRLSFITDEHLKYLDRLRESGDFGVCEASAKLVKRFEIDKKQSFEVLGYWMKTYGGRR